MDEGRASGGANGVSSEGRFASLGQSAQSAGDTAEYANGERSDP